MRVLIVDDNEAARQSLESLLSSADGVSVCGVAADGKDAVAKTKVLKPDVMVLDVEMPQMTGIQAALEISQVSPSTRILMLSAYDVAPSQNEAESLGALKYISKSSSAAELIAALREIELNSKIRSGEF